MAAEPRKIVMALLWVIVMIAAIVLMVRTRVGHGVFVLICGLVTGLALVQLVRYGIGQMRRK